MYIFQLYNSIYRKKIILSFIIYVSVSFLSTAYAQSSRDFISIVGSSTVYPFSTVVAEQFGRNTSFKTPTIESTGSGGGLKLFCSGYGPQYPDITNSSRRIKKSEVDLCEQNGVIGIVEVKIGYDGIALARSIEASQFSVSRKQIYLALAKNVPNPSNTSELIPNPYQSWYEIDKNLPNIRIEVLGPPPTSGTRDAFVELVMDPGCSSFNIINSLNDDERLSACHTMREDGRFIEAGENDNLIVQKLEVNQNALGIFGYSFLDQNLDIVKGSLIDGVPPTFEDIADGSYPVSRPLYFYLKKEHVGLIPGLEEFMDEFTSENAWGDFGYLSERGLIPLSQNEKNEILTAVSNLNTLSLED
tara:strand:+ start:9676 stop:10752 length:1077 start_codon:yes stop_codon:yes gene_type:complete